MKLIGSGVDDKIHYELWTEPPRRRTILISDPHGVAFPHSLEWPWVTYVVMRKGKKRKKFYGLTVLVSHTEPRGVEHLLHVPHLGHSLGNYLVCLGNDTSLPDPISTYWNTVFKWGGAPDPTSWRSLLWNTELVSPKDVVRMNAAARPPQEVPQDVQALIDRIVNHRPPPVRFRRRVAAFMTPMPTLALGVYAAMTGDLPAAAVCGGMAWLLSGLVGWGSIKADRRANELDDREVSLLVHLVAGPAGFFVSMCSTRFFKYGWLPSRGVAPQRRHHGTPLGFYG
jgi:hypothetical protein